MVVVMTTGFVVVVLTTGPFILRHCFSPRILPSFQLHPVSAHDGSGHTHCSSTFFTLRVYSKFPVPGSQVFTEPFILRHCFSPRTLPSFHPHPVSVHVESGQIQAMPSPLRLVRV